MNLSVLYSRNKPVLSIPPIQGQRPLDDHKIPVRRLADHYIDTIIMRFWSAWDITGVVNRVDLARLTRGWGGWHTKVCVTPSLSQNLEFIVDSAVQLPERVVKRHVSMDESVGVAFSIPDPISRNDQGPMP